MSVQAGAAQMGRGCYCRVEGERKWGQIKRNRKVFSALLSHKLWNTQPGLPEFAATALQTLISHPSSTPLPQSVARALWHCPHFYRSACQTPWSFPTCYTSILETLSLTTVTDVCVRPFCMYHFSQGRYDHMKDAPRVTPLESQACFCGAAQTFRITLVVQLPLPALLFLDTDTHTQSCKSTRFFAGAWMSCGWIIIACQKLADKLANIPRCRGEHLVGSWSLLRKQVP